MKMLEMIQEVGNTRENGPPDSGMVSTKASDQEIIQQIPVL